MAANKPNAVAKSASAIPGATIAKLVFLEIAIDWKEFIIPQTVPNNPIKGAVEPTVAKKVKFFSINFNSLSPDISKILLTLTDWTEEDFEVVLITSNSAVWNTFVRGSFYLFERLL